MANHAVALLTLDEDITPAPVARRRLAASGSLQRIVRYAANPDSAASSIQAARPLHAFRLNRGA
jgi:hypothetical protein